MKDLLRKFQAALTATAFAEEGEVETARQIMAEAGMHRGTAPSRDASLELVMAAAAFAEEGDADTARQLLAGSPPPPPEDPKTRTAEKSPEAPSPRRIPG